MSLFSFNFRRRRPLTEINVQKEDSFEPKTYFSAKSETNLSTTGCHSMSESDSTPNLKTSFVDNCENQSFIQKYIQTTPEDLTIDSTVGQITGKSSDLKQRVAEELEKIENWKTITDAEADHRIEEIKNLKKTVEELKNRLKANDCEKNRLKAKLTAELAERDDVLLKMTNTREMMVRVKDCFAQIENRFEALCELKTVIDVVNENRCANFDYLSDQFNRLNLKHKSIVSDMESNLNNKNQEINELVETLEKMSFESNVKRKETKDQMKALDSELNEYKQRIERSETDLKEANHQNRELSSKLIDLNAKYESIVVLSEQKDKNFEIQRKNFETETNELKIQIKDFDDKGLQFEKQINEFTVNIVAKDKEINELKAEIESKGLKCTELETEIQTKNQLINDSMNNIADKEKEIIDLVSEKTDLIQTIDGLNDKINSIESEKQSIEFNAQNDKQNIVSDYEKTIKEFESNANTLREEINELLVLKTQNQTLIEELETNGNQLVIEKKSIEEQLNELKEMSDKRETDLLSKNNDLEKRIDELNDNKEQNELLINEFITESDALKLLKEDLEIRLEREEQSLKRQISNMAQILENCKSDFNKRIDDKENTIKEYRRDNERMRLNVEQLTKKCEKLENERQTMNRKLSELTISSIQETYSSPNRVLTPKLLPPIEKSRKSDHKTNVPSVDPLPKSSEPRLAVKISENRLPLKSGTHLPVDKSVQNRCHRRHIEIGDDFQIKGKSKENPEKGKSDKYVLHLDDSSEDEFEIINGKLKIIRKISEKTEQSKGSAKEEPILKKQKTCAKPNDKLKNVVKSE